MQQEDLHTEPTAGDPHKQPHTDHRPPQQQQVRQVSGFDLTGRIFFGVRGDTEDHTYIINECTCSISGDGQKQVSCDYECETSRLANWIRAKFNNLARNAIVALDALLSIGWQPPAHQ